jgi:hypothetical protein
MEPWQEALLAAMMCPRTKATWADYGVIVQRQPGKLAFWLWQEP